MWLQFTHWSVPARKAADAKEPRNSSSYVATNQALVCTSAASAICCCCLIVFNRHQKKILYAILVIDYYFHIILLKSNWDCDKINCDVSEKGLAVRKCLHCNKCKHYVNATEAMYHVLKMKGQNIMLCRAVFLVSTYTSMRISTQGPMRPRSQERNKLIIDNRRILLL